MDWDHGFLQLLCYSCLPLVSFSFSQFFSSPERITFIVSILIFWFYQQSFCFTFDLSLIYHSQGVKDSSYSRFKNVRNFLSILNLLLWFLLWHYKKLMYIDYYYFENEACNAKLENIFTQILGRENNINIKEFSSMYSTSHSIIKIDQLNYE